jgi:hypothetical protein
MRFTNHNLTLLWCYVASFRVRDCSGLRTLRFCGSHIRQTENSYQQRNQSSRRNQRVRQSSIGSLTGGESSRLKEVLSPSSLCLHPNGLILPLVSLSIRFRASKKSITCGDEPTCLSVRSFPRPVGSGALKMAIIINSSRWSFRRGLLGGNRPPSEVTGHHKTAP